MVTDTESVKQDRQDVDWLDKLDGVTNAYVTFSSMEDVAPEGGKVMKRSRREFLKNMAAAWSTAVAGTMITGCGTDSGAASSLRTIPASPGAKRLAGSVARAAV